MSRSHIQVTLAAGCALGFAACVVRAHHSIALQFDMTRQIEIFGDIVQMEWRNPHSWLHVEVENEAGAVETWRVEFGSANGLYRAGWRRDDLPVGEQVMVHGLPARDGSRQMVGDEVTLANGRSLFAEDPEG